MTAPNDQRQPLQVLALTANPKPMQALLAALRQSGIEVDVASDLQAARSSFFGAGGHDCLVIAPDVRPGMVQLAGTDLQQARITRHAAGFTEAA